jgi:kynurenine formamidase
MKELQDLRNYILELRNMDVIKKTTEITLLHKLNALEKQFAISGVVNCVYVVTERDNYGEQLFKGVFANKEKAIEYLAEDGLKESNIDEINEIKLD